MSKPGRKLSVTGKTRELVILFIKNLLERKFTDAERELQNIKQKRFPNKEYQLGYIKALEGFILSVRSGDERDFYNRPNNGKTLDIYIKEFKEFNGFSIIGYSNIVSKLFNESKYDLCVMVLENLKNWEFEKISNVLVFYLIIFEFYRYK